MANSQPTRLDELCEFAPREGSQADLVFWFVRFVAWLRGPGQSPQIRVRFLQAQLTQHPEYRDNLRATFRCLLKGVEVDRFLAYGGIPLDFHFWGAVKMWLLDHILPAACDTSDGARILRLAFVRRDLAWIGKPETLALFRGLVDDEWVESVGRSLRGALGDLASQIVAQAHSPNVRCLAQDGDRSPYRGLYEAAAALSETSNDVLAMNALRGRVQQCLLLLRSHRTELTERGADLNTTFQLTRMRQQLDRLLRVARLLHDPNDAALGDIAECLVGDVLRDGSGRRLVARSADLVVQNLVESTASVGRDYLDGQRSSWTMAFRAGAAGGALMVLATLAKYFLASLHLPTLYEGIAFSLNYASVFCAAYLLHATIATKLPAHTAAALAYSARVGAGHRRRLEAFTSVWHSMVRLQLAGLVGNLVVAAPLAFLVDRATLRLAGHHVLSPEMCAHALASNSVLGPSALYAALTGLFLWMSSLIGAWGDNWVRVNRVSDRLATNPYVMRRVRPAVSRKWADAFVRKAGGLIGNASLGVLLGGVPAAFAIAKLPVEIRHITVSTSSVALAIGAGSGTSLQIGLAVLGLVAIAAINVSVSFVLALWLALRATRGLRASASAHAILRLGLRGWGRKRPRALPRPVQVQWSAGP